MRALGQTLLVSLWAVVAAAQAPVNPRVVQFVPSADDRALGPDGAPVVVRYDLAICGRGGETTLLTIPLGKPAAGDDGTIQVDFSAIGPWPLADGAYVARVIAVGPRGFGASDPSNGFCYAAAGTCSLDGDPPPDAPAAIAARW